MYNHESVIPIDNVANVSSSCAILSSVAFYTALYSLSMSVVAVLIGQ